MKRAPLLLAASLLLALAAAPARADLYCPVPVVEVGTVRSGPPLRYTFAFVNAGAAAEVLEVRPGCGCLTPRLERKEYPPGAAGELAVEVNTLTQAAGFQSWHVDLLYRSGGETKELTLTLCGRVVTELSLEPAALDVSTCAAVSRTLTLTDRRARPLDVTGVRTTAPQLRASLSGPGVDEEGHRSWTVRLDIGDDLPEGHHQEKVILATTDPACGELTVPVTIDKRPRAQVRAAPEQAELTAQRGRPGPSRIVLLRSGDGEPVVAERVECDGPALSCTWAAGPGALTTLRIAVDPARLDGPEWHGAVRVRLARPAGQTVTVPVACTLR
jgi:hypothetical protein